MTPKQFRTIRKRLGLTQVELAAKLDMSRNMMWRIELPPDNIHHREISLVLEYAMYWLDEQHKKAKRRK